MVKVYEKVAIEALREVKEVLDKHGVEYWLDYGTLLGAVRGGRFIPWDHDIDLGLWHKDNDILFKASEDFHIKGFLVYFFNKKLFKYFKDLPYDKNPVRTSFNFYHTNKEGATTQFFVHNNFQSFSWATRYLVWILSAPHNAGDNPRPIPYALHRLLIKISQVIFPSLRKRLTDIVERFAKKIGCKHIPVIVPLRYFKNLSTIKFYGMQFKSPSPVKEYLAYRYGENWKIPKKNYVYYKEDGAIVKEQ